MHYMELNNLNFDRSQPASESNLEFIPITVEQIDNEILSQTALLDELPVMTMWSYDDYDTVCLRYYDEKHKPVTDKQQLSAIIKAVDIANDFSLCKDIYSKVVLITSAQDVEEMHSEYFRNKYIH